MRANRGPSVKWPVWLVLLALAMAFGGVMYRSSGPGPATAAPPTPAGISRDGAPVAETTPAGQSATDVQVFFSRRDQPQQAIRAVLAGAKNSIEVAMYTFTDYQLSGDLVAAQARGVKVLAYLDRTQATDRYGQAGALAAGGVELRISNNPHIMHNKFAVVDDAVVITGSYNWTHAANVDNDENLVILHSPALAATYRQRFNELWEMWDQQKTAGVYGR
jgi:phosphatidylserine/phosphatidylglycerophosphate/cardiolipin synthase-like enzyme